MTATLSGGEIVLRVALALLAGALVGIDRGEHAEPAGLRTMMLVCLAACLAMLMANLLFAYTPDTRNGVLRLDPMRLPLGMLSGIGFIGGGAILRRGELVLGVTTAATLWLLTVIGLCFGGGWYWLGCSATAIGLVTLWPLRAIEVRARRHRRGMLMLESRADGPDADHVLALLRARGFALRSRQVAVEPQGQRRSLQCNGRYSGEYPDWSEAVISELAGLPGVLKVEWHDVD